MAIIKVPVTKVRGSEKLLALIDEEDLHLVQWHAWCIRQNRKGGVMYAGTVIDGKLVKMHRLIMNAADNEIIDHADGNGLNNTRLNLRRCTLSQNQMNQRKAKAPTRFPYKGVYAYARGRLFAAEVTAHGVRHRRCGLKTVEDAARAYDAMAREVHGEFAKLNFPNETPQPQTNETNTDTARSGLNLATCESQTAH